MPWPLSQDYNEAIQNPATSFMDAELKQGEAVCNALGLPVPCSGNFADVYAVQNGSKKWAVKCFTRQIPGLQERYVQISKYLQQVNLPFMVDFNFLDKGIQVRGTWYPVLKMQWVEGFALNAFVRDNVDKPQVLQTLGQIWLKLAQRLREGTLAHCDLQHGNVLLVPGSKAGSLGVKLVDYDGMCVPALELLKSIELGHANYQHPQRLKEGTYGLQIDRFPHLVIYTAIRALSVGGKALWDKFDNGDNLLFTQKDFAAPTKAAVFQELLKSSDAEVRKLAQALAQAAQKPIDQVPLLDELVEAKTVTKTQSAAPAASKPAAPSAEDVFAAATGSATGRRTKHEAKKKPVAGVAIAAGIGAVVLIGGIVAFATMRGSPTSKGEAVAEVHKTQASRAVNVERPTSAVRPVTKLITQPEVKTEPKHEPKSEPKEEPKSEPKKEPKTEPKSEPKADPEKLRDGLRLKGRDSVEVANTKGLVDLNGDYTIELKVRMRPAVQYLVGDESWQAAGVPVERASGFILRTSRVQGDEGVFNYTVATTSTWWVAEGPVRRFTNEWQHIAVCKSRDIVRVFWDGKLYVSKSCKGEKFVPCPSNFFLGVRQNGWGDRSVNTDYRAFRLSNKALYLKDFIAPKTLEKTDDTLVLFDFTHGDENKVIDQSQHDHEGTIRGGEWLETVRPSKTEPKGEPKTEPKAEPKDVEPKSVPVGEIAQLPGHDGGATMVIFSKDGKRLISGGGDGMIRVWDWATQKETLRLQGHTSAIRGLILLPNGNQLLSSGFDGTIRLWDLEAGKEIRRVGSHNDWIRGLVLSKDAKQAISGSGGPAGDVAIQVWDVETGKELAKVGAHGQNIVHMARSPDGRSVLVGYDGGPISLWDLRTGKAVRQFSGHSNYVARVAISSNGRYALSASADQTVRLWDFASGTELYRFPGHTSAIHAVAFSPDDKWILSAGTGNDNAVRLWDVSKRRLIHTFTGHTAGVQDVAFSLDGRLAASGSDDGSVRVWGLPKSEPTVEPKKEPKTEPKKMDEEKLKADAEKKAKEEAAAKEKAAQAALKLAASSESIEGKISGLKRVIQNHPGTKAAEEAKTVLKEAEEKAAQALLKKAIASESKRQFDEAKDQYKSVMKQYPNTDAAKDAAERLKDLKK